MPLPLLSDPVILNRTFGGAAIDFAHAVVQTADGGYIVCGQTDSYGLGSNLKPDMWIIKIDNKGDKEWDYIPALTVVKLDREGNREWSNPLGDRFLGSAFSVQQSADEGYILSGDGIVEKSANDHSHYALAVKLDKLGNILWKHFGTEYSAAQSICQTEKGEYAVTGNTLDENHGLNLLVYLLDSDGNEKWGNPMEI